MERKTPELVRGVFRGIQSSYDRLDSMISFGQDNRWRKRLVMMLSIPQGGTVLDCGAGTGKLTELVQYHFPGCKTISLDITSEMFRPEKNRNTEFIEGSAEDIPLDDSSVDAVVSSYMTRNLINVDRYFSEAFRVLKPGGMMVNMDIFNPTLPVFSQFFSLYFYRFMPVYGNFLSGTGSYTYLANSVRYFFTPEAISRKIEEAGFSGVRMKRLMLGSVFIHSGIKLTGNSPE